MGNRVREAGGNRRQVRHVTANEMGFWLLVLDRNKGTPVLFLHDMMTQYKSVVL